MADFATDYFAVEDDFFTFALGVVDKLIAGDALEEHELTDLRQGLLLEGLADELRRENAARRAA